MTTQHMTVDELIDHLLEIRQGRPQQEPTLIDLIIEQMLEDRNGDMSVASEFFESVK